jgi:glutathione peroxidase
MRRLCLSILALAVATCLPAAAQDKKKKEPALPPDSIYKLKVKSLDGKDVDLKDFAGKVTLIVNLASQ